MGTEYVLSCFKQQFRVPATAIKQIGKPMAFPTGIEAGAFHARKTPRAWSPLCTKEHLFILELNGVYGLYTTFVAGDQPDADDHRILRAVPNEAALALQSELAEPGSLLKTIELPARGQINPKGVWPVETASLLITYKSKAASLHKSSSSKKKRKHAEDDDDEDESAQTEPVPPVPPPATQNFALHPDSVVLPKDVFDSMMEENVELKIKNEYLERRVEALKKKTGAA